MTGEPSGDHDPWSASAGLYNLQLPLERAALDSLAAALALAPESRLLDVGTGTGGLLRSAAELPAAGRPLTAIGVDRSQPMLDRAGPLPAGWSLLKADARRLPFADGSFDRAAAAYLLHLLDDSERGAVLAELARVLEPGGLLGVITISPPLTAPERLFRRPAELAADRLGGVLTGLRSLDPKADLEAAGFTPLWAARTRRGYPSLITLAERPA